LKVYFKKSRKPLNWPGEAGKAKQMNYRPEKLYSPNRKKRGWDFLFLRGL